MKRLSGEECCIAEGGKRTRRSIHCLFLAATVCNQGVVENAYLFEICGRNEYM
jgi:hypothetical protein